MNVVFSREKLMENISTLMQQAGVRATDVETAIGISAGYLGRMMRKETDAGPSTEIIWKIAQYFGVTVEALITGNMSKAKDNVSLLEQFLDNLREMTEDDYVPWEAIPIQDVNIALASESSTLPIIGEISPKRDTITPEDWALPEKHSLFEEGVRCVKSLAYPWKRVCTAGTGYRAKVSEEERIYIFPMAAAVVEQQSENPNDYVIETKNFYELLMETKEVDTSVLDVVDFPYQAEYWAPHSIIATLDNDQRLSEAAKRLYDAIYRIESDIKLDASVKSMIGRFIRTTAPVKKKKEAPSGTLSPKANSSQE